MNLSLARLSLLGMLSALAACNQPPAAEVVDQGSAPSQPTEAPAPATPHAAEAPAHPLVDTHWRFVRRESMDDTVVESSEGDTLELSFMADGLSMKVDCNRVGAQWESPSPGQLGLVAGPSTLMACPSDRMEQLWLRDLPYVRGYLFRDDRLFITLMADGGIWEFAPIAAPDGDA